MKHALAWVCVLALASGCALYDTPGPARHPSARNSDVEGSWYGTKSDGSGLTLVLRQHESVVTGVAQDSSWGTLTVSGRIRGRSLTLAAQSSPRIMWSGTVDGNRLSGMWSRGQDEIGSWSARRRDDD